MFLNTAPFRVLSISSPFLIKVLPPSLNRHAEWELAQFGHANLNDPRRTRRLVALDMRLLARSGYRGNIVTTCMLLINS